MMNCPASLALAILLTIQDSPKNTTVSLSDPGGTVKGRSMMLNCSSDANPPVENYTWFKLNESTAVGSGQQYSITNIRSVDGGQYYCEARNKYGAENSTAVFIIVEGGQSSVYAAVTISICGAVGLFCLVFFVSKTWKKEATRTRQERSMNPSTQPDAVYQNLNLNTTQPDADYQNLNLNTTQLDAVYQSLNPNNTQLDAITYKGILRCQSQVSPVQPEGEPSPIYSSVQGSQDPSVSMFSPETLQGTQRHLLTLAFADGNEPQNMGLLLLVITSLSVMILVTTKGVCGQQWGVTYQPESICAFVGDSVDLSCSYTYPSALTLKETYWTKENYWDYRDLFSDRDYNSRIRVDCRRAGTCQLRINSLTTSDTGPYNCRITTHTEGGKWIGKPGVQLYVREAQDPPQTTSVSICPPDNNIVEGTHVTLTCISRPDLHVPVLSYSWYKSGHHLTQGTENTYIIHSFTYRQSGAYYCYVSYSNGAPEGSSIVNLQVYYGPRTPVVVIDPPGKITEGSRVTLTCSSDANPPVESYTWFKVNESTAVGSGQQYSITNISSEDGGQYYCEARNRLGSHVSTAVSITARNKYGAENSTTVSITVTSWQSPLSTAVITVSVCGAVGLLCLVFLMSKKCKKNATQTREDRPSNLKAPPVGHTVTLQPVALMQRRRDRPARQPKVKEHF
ncbi:B-cell receptor CD22-like [Alosa sapidissima]|uniref:B-cell receptor CD22-like n=1 Tax=Alosa sapidissima TaxID=34773 RepID=UPI001C0A1756|nr:B-cell receptor CD22-like [Alosa sapidissima]